MTIGQNLEHFAGKPVVDFEGKRDASDVVYRLRQDYDDERSQAEMLDAFFEVIPPAAVESLVIGAWADGPETNSQGYLDGLVARKDQLGALRALFVGDITYEENEISWILQGDYAALLQAFPKLEILRIRGTEQLVLAPFNHTHLHELAIESGGLSRDIVQNLRQSQMPALKHLELWLGDDGYGFDGSIEDFQELLAAIDGSRLAYLGLRNAQISDELAEWLAVEPWTSHLQELDLSMGTLGDVGAQALLDSPYLEQLAVLNLGHHYISDSMQDKLRARFRKVLLNDPRQAEDDGARYVEVSE
jgi:hypothetical protein